MTIAVLPFKQMTGCGSLATDADLAAFSHNCLTVMPFADMLSTQFRTDAHFVSYAIPGLEMWPRLKKSILSDVRAAGMDIVLKYFAFDWDNINHSEWSDDLLASFGELVQACTDPIISAWHTFYTTKHGARFVYKLSAPIPVDAAEHNLAWMINHFIEKGFTQIDGSCKDWTRCMRCPQVIRDGVASWSSSSFTLYSQRLTLDTSLLGKSTPATVATVKHFDKARHSNSLVPDYNTGYLLLCTTSGMSQKPVFTDFYKRSRKVLKDSPYFDIIYNNAATGWEPGSRNDQVMRMIGVLTPILLKSCYASVLQIFALIHGPLLTLGTDQDWPAHGWNALLDIYERENDKLNVLREKEAEKARVELGYLDSIAEGMKEWNNHPLLFQDEETAREYARQNALATVGNFFFTIGADGYYDPFPVTGPQVISRIRKSPLLNDIIPTTKKSVVGEDVDVTSSSIQNSYSTPVAVILMKPVGDRGGYIQDMNGENPALVLSTFSRNDNIEPTFNPYVDEWLQALGGVKYYEKLLAWIGNALAFDEGLICALSLEGASSAGKKLLTIGLSECLKEPCIAGPIDIYGKSSAFLKTPFLVVNESWPDQRVAGISPGDTFKSLLGGDGIRVEEKFKPAMTVLNPIRMILAANDDGIVKTLTRGKDMNLDNRIAIGERLFHFKVGPAEQYLKGIGGMGFTSKPGSRWIRPDSGSEESDYIVAKHFLWLYKNRDPVDPSLRFLVMGNSAPGCGEGEMTVFEKSLAGNHNTPLVATAIIQMLDDKNTNVWGMGYKTGEGQLWVTRSGVYRYAKEILETRVEESEMYSAMQNLLAKADPDRDHETGYSWYEINVKTLAMIAAEWGMKHDTIRCLIKQKTP
jgi:hypothetical protein